MLSHTPCMDIVRGRIRTALLIMVLAIVTAFIGCIDESSTIVTFDQTLESTTFQNRLLTPVVVYRDGLILDTIPPQVTYTYPLNQKGAIRHAWKIVPPRGRSGLPVGVAPLVDLGVQYGINSTYTIDNGSISGKSLFTPRITNLTAYSLLLSVNVGESDYVLTDYVIPPNSITSLTHVPYFYWHSSSNVQLDEINGWYRYTISRQDTGDAQLRLDDTQEFQGSGVTVPIIIYR